MLTPDQVTETEEQKREILEKCFEHVARGAHMSEVEKLEGYPSVTTFWRWMDEVEGAREAYARACEKSADALMDRALDIIDERPPSDDKGRTDSGYVRWQDVRARFRAYLAEKRNPKRYSEKVQMHLDAQVTQQEVTDRPPNEDREAWMERAKEREERRRQEALRRQLEEAED